MVDTGTFRRDLEQRLAGVVIAVPPLRDRPGDIAAIGRAFIAPYVEERSPAARRVHRWLQSAEARRHAWPGNVRELMNVLRNLLLGMPAALAADPVPDPEAVTVPPTIAAGTATLREVEDWYLGRVLGAHDHNYAAAARSLGLDRATVRRHASTLARRG